ncbi:hypothetical protein [Desertivirga xinjiangensis]|uniref:hypothetical protein n=1 Tax=Desertivirga xinjiangensis TaxID=539206 RepID=UPI0021086590|nr:hypothetical protein [Pedobacter xinjiangensis]
MQGKNTLEISVMIDPNISRIDRAVADNIKDIERSFGSQAGIVQDFIIFITSKFKTDLFGYTRFTLQEYCHATGRRRQELAIIHPDFTGGDRKPPKIEGFEFSTVFDFALYSMMERNIIFSTKYEVKGNGQVIHMQNFPILKDLKLNFNRKAKEQKVYDVRLSDELLTGFLYRYYTVNTECYRKVGKGRGGDGRKRLLLYLSKINHVLTSVNNTNSIVIPLDRLCYLANINDAQPHHKKQNLIRTLTYLQTQGSFPFEFTFRTPTGRDSYMVTLTFIGGLSKTMLIKEHNFYCRLIEAMFLVFQKAHQKIGLPDEKDPFQCWLTSRGVDIASKANVLVTVYYQIYSKALSAAVARDLVQAESFVNRLIDVR